MDHNSLNDKRKKKTDIKYKLTRKKKAEIKKGCWIEHSGIQAVKSRLDLVNFNLSSGWYRASSVEQLSVYEL